MMLEELQRRNYSEDTTRFYIRIVEDFSRRFNRPPDRLGPRHIREYQAELFQKRKLSPGTVAHYLSALRFFYIKTLKKGWSVAETPYPKRPFHLPSILSQEEVARLIDAALTPYHRILLMTLYAAGTRNAELTHLKVSDIDSKRMVIHIQGGKGRVDRDVMLSPKLLEELREHWRRLPRKSSVWLFPGNRWHSSGQPIDTKTPRNACQQAAQRAGIQKKVYPRLLRWPISSAPRELLSSNVAASGSAGSTAKCYWPSRGVAPPHWAVISISAPAADIAPPSLTTPAETDIARSVRQAPGNGGLQHVARNFSLRVTSMRSSRCLINWHHWRYRTPRSSTICCSGPVQKHFWKSPAIPYISVPRSVSSACCIPGTKSSSFTRMSIVSFPPVGCRSITPTGLNHATGSFFPSVCSVAFFAASSLPVSGRSSKKADSTSMET